MAYEIFDDALDFHFEWQLIKVTEPKEYDFSSYDFSKEKFISQQDFIKTLNFFYKTNEDISLARVLESLDVEVIGNTTHKKINYRIRQKEKNMNGKNKPIKRHYKITKEKLTQTKSIL